MTGNDRKPIPIANTPFLEDLGQFSPDGRWVAYQTDESGRSEVVVTPFGAAGGRSQISTAGATQPRWSADGNELYYVAPGGMLMAAPIRATSERIGAGAPVSLFQTQMTAGDTGWQYAVARDGRFLVLEPADQAEAAPNTPITLILNWKPSTK